MTTQNSMMERRSSDELNQIRTEKQRLKDEAGVLKEELERTRTTRDLLVMTNYDLEDRLKHSQKALKEMIEEFLGKPVIPTQNFAAALKVYVSEEREACARIADGVALPYKGKAGPETYDALALVAELIRKRT